VETKVFLYKYRNNRLLKAWQRGKYGERAWRFSAIRRPWAPCWRGAFLFGAALAAPLRAQAGLRASLLHSPSAALLLCPASTDVCARCCSGPGLLPLFCRLARVRAAQRARAQHVLRSNPSVQHFRPHSQIAAGSTPRAPSCPASAAPLTSPHCSPRSPPAQVLRPRIPQNAPCWQRVAQRMAPWPVRRRR